ncbi:MAG: universal stress protein [Caldilineaceae bacterium]
MQRERSLVLHPGEPSTATTSLYTRELRGRLTIAAATDGTVHTQQAVVLAGHLAHALQASLKVLVTVRGRVGVAYAQQIMQATQELVRTLEPVPELIPLVGPADEVVGNYLEAHKFDLFVMGAFQDRGAGSVADIGTTAHHLLQYAPASVLIVKRPRLRKLLACVAVDDTHIVEMAIQWAKALGAELQLVHSLIPEHEPHLIWSVTNDMPLDEILARGVYLQRPATVGDEMVALDSLLEQNTPLANFVRETISKLEAAGLPRNALRVQRGKLMETVLAVAQAQRPDLLIIGRHSTPGYFLSSAANSVASLARCSVLVVHEGS